MSDKIIVIGAGVSGITTALVLQALGYSTKIYAQEQLTDFYAPGAPQFASRYPSASVIPHSVYSDQLEPLFKGSQEFFYRLKENAFPGLSIHKHFEIFEFEKTQPEYLKWMHNRKYIENIKSDNIPRRPDSEDLYGWNFDAVFADWPVYFPALTELYRQSGGEIITRKLEAKDIAALPASTVINCSGAGSFSLFDNSEGQLLMRGHLIYVKDMSLISSPDNRTISYNYTPEASEYSDSAGKPCDVYCYPRKDGWILGGSRQAGTLTKNGKWNGAEVKPPLYEVDGTPFPAQIIDLNRQIIEHTFGISLGEAENISPAVGYRYIRSENNGLRLEGENMYGKEVYHNYGHGGAGVTLSWGCAFEIAGKVSHSTVDLNELKDKLISRLEQG